MHYKLRLNYRGLQIYVEGQEVRIHRQGREIRKHTCVQGVDPIESGVTFIDGLLNEQYGTRIPAHSQENPTVFLGTCSQPAWY